MSNICNNNPWYGCSGHSCPVGGSAASSATTGKTIRMRRPHLLFKVANAASIVKDSIPDEDTTHEMRKWIEDITDDGNIERVTDLLDLAFADLLEWLDSRLEDSDIVGDVEPDEDDDYIITTAKAISTHKAKRVLKPRMEEYMTAYVLWQWLLHKGFAAQAAPWKERMDELKDKIRDLLNGGRTKRPITII